MTDREKLQTARGAAIECYAKQESALSLLLTVLLGTNTAKGSAVFKERGFRVSHNPNARRSLLLERHARAPWHTSRPRSIRADSST
jgi:hypothetical protein